MEELMRELEEKRLLLHKLVMEIRELEEKFLYEQWKDKPECQHSLSEVGNGLCLHGKTIRGQIYCNNLNCHK